jgi:long-chain acyl-CoA synthetase
MPAGCTREHADSVGQVLPAADIRVMDDDGRELPPGETGELWIAGPMVVPGYWANPEATAASFTAGYWHSGDLGSVDALGFVRVFDRKKDMLNRGGYKIYSVEVENVLMGCARRGGGGRRRPPLPGAGRAGARLRACPGVPLDEAALRAIAPRGWPTTRCPRPSVTFTDAPLPRNANGKLMKRLLRGFDFWGLRDIFEVGF